MPCSEQKYFNQNFLLMFLVYKKYNMFKLSEVIIKANRPYIFLVKNRLGRLLDNLILSLLDNNIIDDNCIAVYKY